MRRGRPWVMALAGWIALQLGAACGQRTLSLHTRSAEDGESGLDAAVSYDAAASFDAADYDAAASFDAARADGANVSEEGGAVSSRAEAGDEPAANVLRPDRYFPNGSWMYQEIADMAIDPQSSAMTSWVEGAGGWDTGGLVVDFGLVIVQASPEAPQRAFEPTSEFYRPDCDQAPVPLPFGGAVEGEAGYGCLGGGNCHLLVADRARSLLYEQWRANATEERFEGGCLILWNMQRVYPPDGRGDQCTSADGAGLPITPLVMTVEEVSSGTIEHALRFHLPSSQVASGGFVHPGTHAARTDGDERGPTYGSRWRLRADFDMARLSTAGARTVARALQRYGMVLVGVGDMTVSAASDRFSTKTWAGVLGADSLAPLRPGDFEILDAGPRIALTFDCVRNGS